MQPNGLSNSEFEFECNPTYILFVNKSKDFQRASSDNIVYKCPFDSEIRAWDSSIREYGFPICKFLILILSSNIVHHSPSWHHMYIILGFQECQKPILPNGKVEPIDKNSIEPDKNATYSCNEGYRLKGSVNRTCGRDGKFIGGVEPRCKLMMKCLYKSLHKLFIIFHTPPCINITNACVC